LSKASQIRQKAQEFLSKGQTDKAIQEYRRLISIESKNPNLYNELGDIFLRAADKAQAVQNFEKAAVIYEKVALYNNAVAVCKKILRIEPEKVESVFKLAELRAKQNLEGEAVAYFAQYTELVLANPQGLLQRSQKDVERILELMGTNEQALAKGAELFEQLGLKLRTAELYMKLSSIASAKGEEKKRAQYQRKVDELTAGLAPEELEEMNRSAAGEKGAAEAAGAPSVEATPELEGPTSGSAESPPERVNASPEAAGPKTPAESSQAASDASMKGEESAADEVEEEIPAEETNGAEIDTVVNEAVEEAEMIAAMSQGHETVACGAPSVGRAKPAGEEMHPSSGASVATEVPPMRASAAPVPPQASSGSPAAIDGAQGTNLVEEITSDVEKDDLKSHYDLGMAYLEMGLYTEAIKDFQISSRYAELQLSSMEMIGHCFLKHNQPRLAVKQLSRALEIAKASHAESLGIHYNLGLAHEMLGELGPAREHFEEVYIIDMSFRDVADKMKKLSTGS
jgi:tetratricopeptide (TPR) repeat protein